MRHLSEHGCKKNTDGTFSWKYHQGVRSFSLVGLSEGEIKEIWAEIRCLILLLNADNGLPFRCGQNGTLRYFREAQLETIVGAGHLTHYGQVDQTLKHLENFLRSTVSNQESLSQRLHLRKRQCARFFVLTDIRTLDRSNWSISVLSSHCALASPETPPSLRLGEMPD